MEITQLLLIVLGLAVTAGGVAMLLRGANAISSGESGRNVPRPYVSLGVTAGGLVIAYHTYSDFQTMNGLEIVGLFLFGLAFGGAFLIKVFITDKFDLDAERAARDREEPGTTTNRGDKEAGGSGS